MLGRRVPDHARPPGLSAPDTCLPPGSLLQGQDIVNQHVFQRLGSSDLRIYRVSDVGCHVGGDACDRPDRIPTINPSTLTPGSQLILI